VSAEELLVRIRATRNQLDKIERALRKVGGGTKEHGRQMADLRERANELEVEVWRTLGREKAR
jgi:hypothetical protein